MAEMLPRCGQSVADPGLLCFAWLVLERLGSLLGQPAVYFFTSGCLSAQEAL